MKIKILYEDENILAIDKPSGISVHKGVGNEKEETVSDWFVKKYPDAENVGEPILVNGVLEKKAGIVHRLDRETSGVLLLAKNQNAYEFLKNQFKEREVKKIYHAIVSGNVKNDHGTIDKPIGRSPNDFRRRLSGRGARGNLREAVTLYKVLKRFKLDEFPLTYLEIYPKTGRTHQIRTHMKFINHPIVCDRLYDPKGRYPKIIGRLALHALSIEFKNMRGEAVKVESPLPLEFDKVLT